MVEASDLLLLSGAVILTALFSTTVLGMELPGTVSGDLKCSIPGVDCTDVAERYDLTTEITVGSTDVNAGLSGFEYSTKKSSFGSLSVIGGFGPLAFGANNVEVSYQLVSEEGDLVSDGSKYVGDIEALESEQVVFESTDIPTGMYTAKYELEYTKDFEAFEGETVTKTLEKDLRVPKRIE